MKNLRIIFYVVRITEITIRILEKSFKYTTKFLKRNKTNKVTKSKVHKLVK